MKLALCCTKQDALEAAETAARLEQQANAHCAAYDLARNAWYRADTRFGCANQGVVAYAPRLQIVLHSDGCELQTSQIKPCMLGLTPRIPRAHLQWRITTG